MHCDRYRKMLHLYRAGELTERERAELQAHLRTCRRCATEQEKILRADQHIEEIRRISPTLERPGVLAERIMTSLRQSEEMSNRNSLTQFIDRLLDSFSIPSIRYLSAFIVVTAIGSFSVQYVSLLQDIDNLQQSMAGRSRTAARQEVAYSIRTEEVRHLADPDLLQLLSPLRDQAQTRDVVIISGNTLKSLMSLIQSGIPNLLAHQYRVDRDRHHIDMLIRKLQKTARPLLTFP